jgi:hypothetical protein
MATREQILVKLRKAVDEAGSIRNFEAAYDVWNVAQILSGKQKLSSGVLAVLGYKQEIRYVAIKSKK